ncbi:MAG: hypothetical protein IJJ25_04010 [Lachnospiraceae bacterium]|nr:hypothetical protein [Lachnospiraceae bacterium]
MSQRPNNLFYAVREDLWNTIRLEIKLTEPVEAAALEQAAALTASRFPYFAVKLVRDGEHFILEQNDAPFVITHDIRPVRLNSAQSGQHLISFAWEGDLLFIDTTHFMMDGQSMFPFLQTLLYCYLKILHPEAVFDESRIALPGSEIPAEELDDDPYPDSPVPVEPFPVRKRPGEILKLAGQPKEYDNMKHWTSFILRVRQRELMNYVSGVDGSPASFAASMMCRAMQELYPENSLPIVCGMQHQFRGALGKLRSHLCHVNIVPIVYPDSLRTAPIDRLNTIGRGTLILQADDEHDLLTVNAHIRNEQAVRDMTLSEKQDYMRRVLLDGIGNNTFEVSYTGRVNWAGLDRYISYVAPCLDLTLSGGVSVEIFSCADDFMINIMQRNEDHGIITEIRKLFKENGIACMIEKAGHFEIAEFEMP